MMRPSHDDEIIAQRSDRKATISKNGIHWLVRRAPGSVTLGVGQVRVGKEMFDVLMT